VEILSAEKTASRLPYLELADAIREVALARRSGTVQAPPRLALPLAEDGVLLVMPASDAEISITKLVTVHPENVGRGLPTIQGEVVVMEAATGSRLGLLDGTVVTARRTAALSMLAARELAPHPDGPLLVVGAGTQGRSHLEAFREGLGVSEVFIYSRTTYRELRRADGARGGPGNGRCSCTAAGGRARRGDPAGHRDNEPGAGASRGGAGRRLRRGGGFFRA
jgi:ornithine cyclodeaminase